MVEPADDQGDVRAAARLSLPVHGRGVGGRSQSRVGPDEPILNGMDAERREFFRVMVRLPVSCAALDDKGRTSLMVVRSVDLSAGGVKVVTEHSLVAGNRVRVVFRIDDETTARLDATVLRVEFLDDGLRRYAIDFDPVERTVEQRLMRAVYAAEQVNAGRHRHVRMTVW